MVDTSKAHGRLGSKQVIDEMSWPEIKAAIDNGQRTVVFAAGSMEQHGPHLPIQTDTLLGTALTAAIVTRLPGVLRGPTIPFGVSEHHMPFAGTITLDTATFKEVVRQYVMSLAAHGFTDIFVIPSHGGNFAPLRELEHETQGSIAGARFIAFSDLLGFLEAINAIAEWHGITPAESGAHAGEAETSMVLAARDDLVSMDHAEAGFVAEFDEKAQRAVFEQGMVALTSNGILGDARPATAERGIAYREGMADFLAAWIRERLP